jgi:four helix bundle protein
MIEKLFRFQDFEIWKKAADLNLELFKIADDLEKDRKFKFAEQLRSAALSITNNIAEGSGSLSDNEFKNFLNIARRSVFEVASMLILLERAGSLEQKMVSSLLNEL